MKATSPDTLTCLELLDGIVKPPALHLTSVKLVLLLGHSLFEGADLFLCVSQSPLDPSQSRLLHRQLHLVWKQRHK